MERSTATQTGQPSDPGRRSRLPPSWLLWTLAMLLLGVALVVRTMVGGEPGGAPPPPGPDRGPMWDIERPIGEVVLLTGGAVARVNGLEPDVVLAPGLPQPEPGTRLVRADVEVCAGEEERLAEPSFWVGLGDDNAVHSAHMGVRDFRTFTLAPGGCQRGYVDIALPEGVDLHGVLLMDHTRTTVAAWAAGGDPAEQDPLSSGVTPEAGTLGEPSELLTTGAATLHDVVFDPAPPPESADAGATVVRIDGEVCAEQQDLLTGSGNWLLQLADHRLVLARRDDSTMPTDGLTAGTCQRGTADFLVPPGSAVSWVLYAYGGIYEEARWRVGG